MCSISTELVQLYKALGGSPGSPVSCPVPFCTACGTPHYRNDVDNSRNPSLQVEELAKAKLEAPKRLREQAAKEWREIDDATFVFDRPQVEVAALCRLTKTDLLTFFEVANAPLFPHHSLLV